MLISILSHTQGNESYAALNFRKLPWVKLPGKLARNHNFPPHLLSNTLKDAKLLERTVEKG